MGQSAADREVQAREDVDRIARALYRADDEDLRSHYPELAAELPAPDWDEAGDEMREHVRRVVRSLLIRDVVRVGHRPIVERPMDGQMEIDT